MSCLNSKKHRERADLLSMPSLKIQHLLKDLAKATTDAGVHRNFSGFSIEVTGNQVVQVRVQLLRQRDSVTLFPVLGWDTDGLCLRVCSSPSYQ